MIYIVHVGRRVQPLIQGRKNTEQQAQETVYLGTHESKCAHDFRPTALQPPLPSPPSPSLSHDPATHFPVADSTPALYVHEDAATVYLAAVPPLVGKAHVVLVLILDEGVPAYVQIERKTPKVQ